MSAQLTERLAQAAYETMMKDTIRLGGLIPPGHLGLVDHSWNVQSPSVRRAWLLVVEAIQAELKTPEWPAVGDEYVLNLKDPRDAVGCIVQGVTRNEQGVWIVYYQIYGGGQRCSVLWEFQDAAKDYREWNSLLGAKS